MNELLLTISLLIIVILALVNQRIDKLPKWVVKDNDEVDLYKSLALSLDRANSTITEQKKRIKKLEVALSIKRMNASLEGDDEL